MAVVVAHHNSEKRSHRMPACLPACLAAWWRPAQNIKIEFNINFWSLAGVCACVCMVYIPLSLSLSLCHTLCAAAEHILVAGCLAFFFGKPTFRLNNLLLTLPASVSLALSLALSLFIVLYCSLHREHTRKLSCGVYTDPGLSLIQATQKKNG